MSVSYSPRPYFVNFHKRSQRQGCLVAHRRAGKTVACVADLVASACSKNITSGRFAYIAPFLKQGREIAWSYLQSLSRPWARKMNQSELSVTFANDNTIKIYGIDNPDALRGLRFDGCICDEFGDWKAGAFNSVILPTLIDRNGWFVAIGTAKGHNDFYEMYKAACANPAEWYVDNLKASVTNILDAKLLANAKAMMSADQYEREFENNFESSVPGAYYGEAMAEVLQSGRIREVGWIPNLEVCTAWDLGRSDSTCITFWQETAGQIHIIDFCEDHGKDVEHYARVIEGKPYRYKMHYLPHDSRTKTLASNYSVIEQLAMRLGIENFTVLAQHHVQDGIQATRNILARTWFDAVKAERLCEALRAYQREFDTEKKCFKETPLHDWSSHPADSMRYLAQAIDLRRRGDSQRKEFDWDNPPVPTFDEVIRATERAQRRQQRI